MNIGRYEHHQLASMLAKRADMSDEEASGLSGYSVATISNFRHQSEFKKLVEFYRKQDQPPPRPELMERIHALGTSTLEELKERLQEDPESWTKHELLQMARLLLVEAGGAKDSKGTGEPGKLRVAIQFVSAPKEEPLQLEDARTIEHESPS